MTASLVLGPEPSMPYRAIYHQCKKCGLGLSDRPGWKICNTNEVVLVPRISTLKPIMRKQTHQIIGHSDYIQIIGQIQIQDRFRL